MRLQRFGSHASTIIVMHVDVSLPLWPFLDLYGVLRIRSLGIMRLMSRYGSTSTSVKAIYTSSMSDDSVGATGSGSGGGLRVALPHRKQQVQLPSPSGIQATGDSSECSVCYEREVDCVLYTCGHMCLCFTCAQDVLMRPDPLCPICRATIRDVIKTYRS